MERLGGENASVVNCTVLITATGHLANCSAKVQSALKREKAIVSENFCFACVHFGQLICPESYVQYVAAHSDINMPWIAQAKQIMSVEKPVDAGVLDNLCLCAAMPALYLWCNRTKFYDLRAFKTPKGDYTLAKRWGRLTPNGGEYAIHAQEHEYRATDANAHEKCEREYKECKALRKSNKYVPVPISSKSNTISSPVNLCNNNTASPMILPLQTTSTIAEKTTASKKRKPASSSVAKKTSAKRCKKVPDWLGDALSRIKTIDISASLDNRLVAWKLRADWGDTTVRYLSTEDSADLQTTHRINIGDLKKQLAAEMQRRKTKAHREANGGKSESQVNSVEYRRRYKEANGGKSEYEVKTAVYKEANGGMSEYLVESANYKEANGGMSECQVKTAKYKEANGGMSEFQVKSEEYRLTHDGHSKIQVERVLAQVAEQANSINVQLEGSN
jgi:hypothetical protein